VAVAKKAKAIEPPYFRAESEQWKNGEMVIVIGLSEDQ
jgi:hypothetical protein